MSDRTPRAVVCIPTFRRPAGLKKTLESLAAQAGANDFAVDGDFTIRGVTKHERLTLTVSGKGTESGTIVGAMAFDRKEYGMNSGIPFIKIADRVEVDVNLRWQRVSGPPLALPK